MRTSGIRALAAGVFLLLAATLLTTRADATSYTFDEVYNVSGQVCTAGGCFFAWQAPPGLFLHTGDVVNLNVTFSTPTYSVPGATGMNALYGVLLDTNYFTPTIGTPTVDSSTSTETLVGYNGPAGVSTGPSTFTANGFYTAYASLAGPNGGFSVTGFDAVFDINNSDPNAIEFLAVETQLISAPTVPEPGTIGLVMLAIGFLFAACMRFPQALGRTV